MLMLLREFTPASVTIIIAFSGVLVWWIRGMPARELANIERVKAHALNDASLRNDLLRRIGELERQIIDDRMKCDTQIRDMQQRFDGVIRQFITYQLRVAQAIPPEDRSINIEHMLESLQPLLLHEYPAPSEQSEPPKPAT